MRSHKNRLLRSGAGFFIAASFAFAYPDAGTMVVSGPSDFVGLVTIKQDANSQTVSGYGGGYTGTITDNVTNKSTTALLFCVDFSNDISIPVGPVNVHISALTNGSDISNTRFGNVANNAWRTVQTPLSATQQNTLTSQNPNPLLALNGATALQRYQMAAYLISQYSFLGDHPVANVVHGDNASRGIQTAIWSLLDANGETYDAPSDAVQAGQTGNITDYLTAAANWLQSGDRSFLSQFTVVTGDTVLGLNSGPQELLMYTPVPEPGYAAFLGVALLGLLWTVRRYQRA